MTEGPAAGSWTEWARSVPALGHSAVLDAPDDPLDGAVMLAEAGLDDEHIVYECDGVWHFAAGSAVTLSADAAAATVRARGRTWPLATDGRPLDALAAALAELRAVSAEDRTVYGWVAFELAHLLHGDPSAAGTDPLLHCLVPSVEITLRPGKAELRSVDGTSADRIATVLREATPDAVEAVVSSRAVTSPEARLLVDTDTTGYREAVAGAVADIRAGLIDKAVVSRVVALPHRRMPDLSASYLVGRRANTPARSFLLNLGGQRAAGFSPETVIEVDHCGNSSTQPLAGTRAFGTDAAENSRLRTELLADSKEVHEHAVSVRLACEEMASVCRPDSVAVAEFMTVKERGSVQHLASRVVGHLADGTGQWAAFAALFPAITATGVPKSGALAAIGRHEREPRGLYGGAVFRAGTDGSLDAALVLRTVFVRGDRAWLQAGAGIMGDSAPEREFEETKEKLRSVAPFLRFVAD